MEGLLSDEIDLAPQEVLRILLQGDVVQEAAPHLQPNEEVEVAAGLIVTTGDGPEQAHVAGAMPARLSR